MDIVTRNSPKPPQFAWLVLWLSQFLIIGCLYSIPTLALRRPPRPGLPPHAPDWHLPLLLSAVYASAMTWQGWYTRNSDKGRYKPKPRLDPAAKRKQRLVLGLVLSGPLLLMECAFFFGMAGGQPNWPLLIALNGGMAAGWGLLAWTTRLVPDPVGPDADPLVVEAVPVAGRNPPPEPVREIAYADRARLGPPLRFVWTLTFLGTSAMAVALIAGASGRFWDALSPLGIPMALLIAVAVTVADQMQRKRSQPTTKAAQNATSLLISFLAIQVLLRVTDLGHREDWFRLLALDVGALAAYGFTCWTLTLAVAAPAVSATSAKPMWLPRHGAAWPKPTELVLSVPLVARLLLGSFALAMWGIVGAAFVVAFDPGVFPGSQPHGIFWRILPGACGIVLSFFALMFTSIIDPRELRLNFERRTYTQQFWTPLPGFPPKSGLSVPFLMRRIAGTMDADIEGLGLREYRRDGNSRYLLQLVWKDAARPVQVLQGFSEAEEAREAMLAASAALGLPALGRCE